MIETHSHVPANGPTSASDREAVRCGSFLTSRWPARLPHVAVCQQCKSIDIVAEVTALALKLAQLALFVPLVHK